MAKITWGNPGEKLFEIGVDRGVLYPRTGPGVGWPGLIAVTESPSGGESTPFYMDGIKYADRGTAEEFNGTIEAYTYPPEFGACDGTAAVDDGLFATQQYRQPFGFTYRTKVGNDLDGQDHGYKIHIVYNARAAPSERGNQTLNDSPEAVTFSWGFTTIPAKIPGIKPSAHLVVDSTKTHPFVVAAIEDLLYGTDSSLPELPTPADLIEIYLQGGPIPDFRISGPDAFGKFTATGSASAVSMLDPDHFQLVSFAVIDNGDGTFIAQSEDPSTDPEPEIPVEFTVGTPNSNGVFTISGPEEELIITSDSTFTLDTEHVVDNEDGSYTTSSD